MFLRYTSVFLLSIFFTNFFHLFLIVFTLYFTIPAKISLLQYHFRSKGTARYLPMQTYVRCCINEKDALRNFPQASSFLYTNTTHRRYVRFVTVQYLHSYTFHKTVPAE